MKFAIKCQSKRREFSFVARARAGHAIKEMFRKFSVLLGGSEADAVQKRWAGFLSCGQQLKILTKL